MNRKNINKKYITLSIITVFIFLYMIVTLFKLYFIDNNRYENLLLYKTGNIYTGALAPRGNIYDRNGNLLVGNKEINIITYINSENSIEDEIKLSILLAEKLDLNYKKVTEDMIKEYLFLKHEEELEEKLDKTIINNYKNRLITKDEYKEELKKLISKEEINSSSSKAAYIYYLMNNGYSSSIKTIKDNDVTKEEIKYIKTLKDDGFNIDIKYVRYYPYGSVFRTLLGDVGKIPKEELKWYLDNGYNMNSIVGISYIEKQYENYLKGINETYTLSATGEKTVLTSVKKGNDIVLSIDITAQKKIEKIILSEIKKASKEPNTEYYKKSYALISNPNTGEILVSTGTGATKTFDKIDYSTDLITTSVTPGSIVKGASHLVGYSTGNLSIGYSVYDSCIKIKNTPEKCSWRSLGYINDIDALAYSSNYYQFLIAIKVAGGKYAYNKPLYLNKKAFKTYRDMYNSFGLGVKTGIDLPNESIGYVGDDSKEGNILDFAIGQYDTYTPMQLLQYINTLASSGSRVKLHYLKSVYEDYSDKDSLIYEYKTSLLNTVNVKKSYMNRVRKGLKEVMNYGSTAYGYVDLKYKPSGKTGTSQSFIDTDNDGLIDLETFTTTFGMYAPIKNPKVSMVVISPHISSQKTSYYSSVNKRISRKISDFYLSNY